MDHPQSPAAASARLLLGCWELVSWTRIDSTGSVTYPCTSKASGRIIYDRTGRVSAFLMHPEWRNHRGGTDNMFLSYSGRYSLDGDIVSHAVDMSSDRRLIGETLRRRIVPEGELVALETLASVGRDTRESMHRLVWRRAV